MRVLFSPAPRFTGKPNPLSPQQIQQMTTTIEQHLHSQQVAQGSFSIKVYQVLAHIDINVAEPRQLPGVHKALKSLPGIQNQGQRTYYQGREVFVSLATKP